MIPAAGPRTDVGQQPQRDPKERRGSTATEVAVENTESVIVTISGTEATLDPMLESYLNLGKVVDQKYR